MTCSYLKEQVVGAIMALKRYEQNFLYRERMNLIEGGNGQNLIKMVVSA